MDLPTVRKADEVSCMSQKISVPSAKSVSRVRSPLRKVTNNLKLTYYRYEVTLGLSIMTFGEKLMINTILFTLLSLLAAACFFYLPSVTMRFASRLAFYFYGTLPVEASKNVIHLISTTATATSTAFFRHRAANPALNATARIEL